MSESKSQTTAPKAVLMAVAMALAPKAWAVFGRLGVDTIAQEAWRTASMRHARLAIQAYEDAMKDVSSNG